MVCSNLETGLPQANLEVIAVAIKAEGVDTDQPVDTAATGKFSPRPALFILAMHQLALLGLLQRYLLPNSPELAARSLHVMGAAALVLALSFTRGYLSTRETLPRIDP